MTKNSTKKIRCFALLSAFLITGLSGCDNPLNGSMVDNQVSVDVSSQSLGLSISTHISKSFDNYVCEDSVEDNTKLKKFAFVSLMDSQDFGIAKLASSTVTDEKDNKSFLQSLGFKNVQETIVGSDATEDINDNAKIVISHKLITANFFNRVKKILVNVSVPVQGLTSEWQSNFDIGADSPYYEGTHSDWEDKLNHKGFDVSATRAYEFVKDYLVNSGISSYKKPVYILVSGFSRGAAISNLLTKKMIDKNPIEGVSFTPIAYTFATPRTTTSSDCDKTMYKNIINYVSDDDIVTTLPPASLDFKRFGVDKHFSLQNDEDAKTRFNTIYGSKYNASCASTLIDIINSMLTNGREDIYKFDETKNLTSLDSDNGQTVQSTKSTIESAVNADASYASMWIESELTNYKKEIPSEDPECEPRKVTYYKWSCYFKDQIILQALANFMGAYQSGNLFGGLSYLSVLDYTRFKSAKTNLLTTLIGNTKYFSQSHSPIAYFVGCFAD